MTACASLQLPHTFVRAIKPVFEDGDSQDFLAFHCDQSKPKSKPLHFLIGDRGVGLGRFQL
jgi:hypothetical protein